jgi:hypothetical protein
LSSDAIDYQRYNELNDRERSFTGSARVAGI